MASWSEKRSNNWVADVTIFKYGMTIQFTCDYRNNNSCFSLIQIRSDQFDNRKNALIILCWRSLLNFFKGNYWFNVVLAFERMVSSGSYALCSNYFAKRQGLSLYLRGKKLVSLLCMKNSMMIYVFSKFSFNTTWLLAKYF
jgi:hypothetical protein